MLPHRRVGVRGRGKILIKDFELDAFLDNFQVLPPTAPRPKEVKPTLVLKHLKLS